jgi:hypothetical protein
MGWKERGKRAWGGGLCSLISGREGISFPAFVFLRRYNCSSRRRCLFFVVRGYHMRIYRHGVEEA